MSSKEQEFRKWSNEEKLEIVKKHLNEHISVKDLSKECGSGSSMICHWVKQDTEEGETGLACHRGGNPYVQPPFQVISDLAAILG